MRSFCTTKVLTFNHYFFTDNVTRADGSHRHRVVSRASNYGKCCACSRSARGCLNDTCSCCTTCRSTGDSDITNTITTWRGKRKSADTCTRRTNGNCLYTCAADTCTRNIDSAYTVATHTSVARVGCNRQSDFITCRVNNSRYLMFRV